MCTNRKNEIVYGKFVWTVMSFVASELRVERDSWQLFLEFCLVADELGWRCNPVVSGLQRILKYLSLTSRAHFCCGFGTAHRR